MGVGLIVLLEKNTGKFKRNGNALKTPLYLEILTVNSRSVEDEKMAATIKLRSNSTLSVSLHQPQGSLL